MVNYLLALVILLFANAAVAETPETLNVSHLVLYQPDTVVRSRVRSDDEFVNYIKEINVAADTVLSQIEVKSPQSGAIVVVVKPNGLVRVWFAEREGRLAPQQREEIVVAVEGVSVLEVNGGVVTVAIGYSSDGSVPADSSLPVPDEWKSAIPKGKSVEIPDDVIELIWPAEAES